MHTGMWGSHQFNSVRKSLEGGISSKLTYKLVFILALLEIILMLGFSGSIGYEGGDTRSYYFAFEEIKDLRPNSWRTPVYPVVYGGLCSLLGDYVGTLLTLIIQIMLFFISLGVLRRSCEMLWKSKRLTFWIVTVYALWPPAPSIVCFLNSEGIAMPVTVILTWVSLKAIRYPSWKRAAAVGLLTIILIFTRPSFVFLLVFIPFGWIILICIKKKEMVIPAVIGICVSLIGWLLLWGYIGQMEKVYGTPVITQVGHYNNYFLLREVDAIDPETISNPEVKQLMERYVAKEDFTIPEGYIELKELQKYISDVEFYEMINTNIMSHKGIILKGLIARTYRVSLTRLNFLSEDNPFSKLIAPISLNFGSYYILMILTTLLIVWQTIGRHKFPVMTVFLWTFSLCITIVAIAGAMNDWARLVVCGECLWMMLIGSCMNLFHFKKNQTCLP